MVPGMFVGVPRLFWFQRFHCCFEGFQGCFQMPCKAPNKPIIFLRAARAFLTTLATMPQLASVVCRLSLCRVQLGLMGLPYWFL